MTRTTMVLIIAIVLFSIGTTSFGETASIYDALEAHGLPMGLLPKGVENYSLGEDGRFEVFLEQACNAKFESELHYDVIVSGQISVGQIRNLTGISAQDLFLWFPVKGIRVDIPSTGIIYFDVGVVFKQFSLSLFETPPDCVASDQLHRHRHESPLLPKKLEGALKYRFNKEKNGREVM